ncbi:2-oxoacid:acceptor oxidoreductase family protein [Chloroflexota bacterium]
MNAEIAIGGSGGQGVLFIGRLLAEAGLLEKREVVFLPSYGAEKRGGTVACNVIISDEKIGALFTTQPNAAIVMNPASFEKLELAMKPKGLLVVNQSLVASKAGREDIRAIYVPANDLAEELGDGSISNVIALGALVAAFPVVASSSIVAVMENMLGKKQKQLELNKRAFNKGCSIVPMVEVVGFETVIT